MRIKEDNGLVLCKCCVCNDEYTITSKEARDYINTEYCSDCLLS